MPENSAPYPTYHRHANVWHPPHQITTHTTIHQRLQARLHDCRTRCAHPHLPDDAQDVTPTRASYHYVYFEKRITTRHGYLLFRFNDADVRQAELLTKGVLHPAIYRWLDEQWQEFPSASHRDGYAPLIGRDNQLLRHKVSPSHLCMRMTHQQMQASSWNVYNALHKISLGGGSVAIPIRTKKRSSNGVVAGAKSVAVGISSGSICPKPCKI
jgi:hypothetical protein